MNNKIFREILGYLLAVVLCLVLFVFVTKIWKQDLNIPGTYFGDSFFSASVMKGFLEKGTYLSNDRIGAPYGANFNDFPSSDSLHYGIARILSLFTHKWEPMMQLIFMLSFPLSVMSAMFVFRHFRISILSAAVGSVLFAFLPYHFLRGINHLFLACYFTVPLGALVAIEILNGTFALKFKSKTEIYRSAVFIVSCILLGCSGIYYAFFSCFFFVVAGVVAAFRERSSRNLHMCAIAVLLVMAALFINLLPSISYSHKYGVNPEVALRSPAESELYGLKIAQLLLPVKGHRVGRLANLKSAYNTFPLINENDSATLGIFGSIGFLLLIGALFIKESGREGGAVLLRNLGLLNLGGVLFATVGGFGTLFSLLISPKIRAYNRISIFIAFFSLFAFVMALDWLADKAKERYRVKTLFVLLPALALILAAGIFDETTRMLPSESIKKEYLSDKGFVSRLEESLPKKSMIFQLPYVPFPENPPVNNMADYELFRGYLNSSELGWSYGVIKGRPGDRIYRSTAALPEEKMAVAVCALGYSGIYIDRSGYADNAAALEKKLAGILKEDPLVSENRRLAFFALTGFKADLLKKYGGNWLEKIRKELVGYEKVSVLWLGSFYTEERSGSRIWRWCSSKGEIQLVNLSDTPKEVVIEASVFSGYPAESALEVSFNGEVDALRISSCRSLYAKTTKLSPGVNRFFFKSNAPRAAAEKDFRNLRFAVENFSVREPADPVKRNTDK